MVPMPALTKGGTWFFKRTALGSNNKGGEGVPQQCLHGVDWRCILGHLHRMHRPISAQCFHQSSPNATPSKTCPPKLAGALQALQHIIAASASDYTTAPHVAMLHAPSTIRGPPARYSFHRLQGGQPQRTSRKRSH
jgi:hypothetical protein